jgi:hypothetical protein
LNEIKEIEAKMRVEPEIEQMSENLFRTTFRQASIFAANSKNITKTASRRESPMACKLLNPVSMILDSRQQTSSRKSLPKQARFTQQLVHKQKRMNTSADKCSEATLRARPNRSDSPSDSNLCRDINAERKLSRSQKLFIAGHAKPFAEKLITQKPSSKETQKFAFAMSHHDLLIDKLKFGNVLEKNTRIDSPLAVVLKPGFQKYSSSKAFLNSNSGLHLRKFLSKSPECDRTANISHQKETVPTSALRARQKKKRYMVVPQSHLKSNRSSSRRATKP